MPTYNSRVSSRVTKKSGFKFRWWMGLGLVVIVAAVGIYVLRFSQASAYKNVTNTFTTWNFEQFNEPVKKYEWVVTPHTDPNASTEYGFFWSNDFGFIDSNKKEHPAYIGMQTVVVPLDLKRGVIFSIWDSKSAVGPEYHGSYNNEGSGLQTAIQYPWQKDKSYKFKVELISEGTNGNVWKGTVQSLDTGVVNYIGSITVPSDYKPIAKSGSWTEYFGNSTDTTVGCNSFPPIKADFTDARINGKAPLSWHNSYEEGQQCSAYSNIVNLPNGTQQAIGGFVKTNHGIQAIVDYTCKTRAPQGTYCFDSSSWTFRGITSQDKNLGIWQNNSNLTMCGTRSATGKPKVADNIFYPVECPAGLPTTANSDPYTARSADIPNYGSFGAGDPRVTAYIPNTFSTDPTAILNTQCEVQSTMKNESHCHIPAGGNLTIISSAMLAWHSPSDAKRVCIGGTTSKQPSPPITLNTTDRAGKPITRALKWGTDGLAKLIACTEDDYTTRPLMDQMQYIQIVAPLDSDLNVNKVTVEGVRIR